MIPTHNEQLSNKEKSEHGRNAQKALSNILDRLGFHYEKNKKFGRENHKPDQFEAQYLVTISEDEQWILYSSTSCRSDRLKGNQWDADNIKQIESKVKKAYIIYPDGCKDKDRSAFANKHEDYSHKISHTALDGCLSQSQLTSVLQTISSVHLSQGQMTDLRGRQFEAQVVDILNNEANLRKWKKADKTAVGIYYELFLNLVTSFGLQSDSTKEIIATKDVPKLKTGGSPKTDVLVRVISTNDQESVYTLSCKKTTAKAVSVHEYSANAFSQVLDPNNGKLANLLDKLQTAGGLKAFGEPNCEALTKELELYRRKLAEWALGGKHGLGIPHIQWANYLVCYDATSNQSSVHTISDYIDLLESQQISGHFGTFFKWTYPSGGKGKRIQLKCKILR